MPKRFGIDPGNGGSLNDIQRGLLATVEYVPATEANAPRKLGRSRPPDDEDS